MTMEMTVDREVCAVCMERQFHPSPNKVAWELSSANSLADAKLVSDPPSYWAGCLMEEFHSNGHDWDEAVKWVRGEREEEKR